MTMTMLQLMQTIKTHTSCSIYTGTHNGKTKHTQQRNTSWFINRHTALRQTRSAITPHYLSPIICACSTSHTKVTARLPLQTCCKTRIWLLQEYATNSID